MSRVNGWDVLAIVGWLTTLAALAVTAPGLALAWIGGTVMMLALSRGDSA